MRWIPALPPSKQRLVLLRSKAHSGVARYGAPQAFAYGGNLALLPA